MKNEEMICKNCKYHYIEDISFDYQQSCCSKREATTEEWCKCNDFEYSNKYIEQLQQENKQLKYNWKKLKEYIEETKLKEFEKSYGKRYGKTFTQAEIIVCNMIKEKMQELEQGIDINVKD